MEPVLLELAAHVLIPLGMVVDKLYVTQAVSIMRCGAECVKINCEGFSFHPLAPDVGMCNMIMTKNVTYQPQEGAEYYTEP